MPDNGKLHSISIEATDGTIEQVHTFTTIFSVGCSSMGYKYMSLEGNILDTSKYTFTLHPKYESMGNIHMIAKPRLSATPPPMCGPPDKCYYAVDGPNIQRLKGACFDTPQDKPYYTGQRGYYDYKNCKANSYVDLRHHFEHICQESYPGHDFDGAYNGKCPHPSPIEEGCDLHFMPECLTPENAGVYYSQWWTCCVK
jgi:hypothetical protein